jgi:hypothetical protein
MVSPARPTFRLALVATIVVVAFGGIALFSGDARFAFIGLAMTIVLLPLLATGIILLLHRLGLIDEEAAGRLGCLHGLGLLALPVLVLALSGVFRDSPLAIFVLPAGILGTVYGGDVLMAIAFRLGLTNRRSLWERTPASRRMPKPSLIRDPGRAAVGHAVDAYCRVLRVTERESYGPRQAVGRLLLIVTLPMFALGVFGVMIAIGGYDGTPLMIIGFVGGTIGLGTGLFLGISDGRR